MQVPPAYARHKIQARQGRKSEGKRHLNEGNETKGKGENKGKENRTEAIQSL